MGAYMCQRPLPWGGDETLTLFRLDAQPNQHAHLYVGGRVTRRCTKGSMEARESR